MRNIFNEYIKSLVKIDSHEHFPKIADLARQKIDLIDLFTPYICDLVLSSGCSESEWQDITNKSIMFDERLKMFNKYLPKIKHCTYFKALELAITEVFGCDINDYEKINNLLKNANEKFYDDLFKKYNIESAATFLGYYHLDYFADSKLNTVPTVTYAIPYTQSILHELEKCCAHKIENLAGLKKAYYMLFDEYKHLNIKNIKMGMAYWTKLDADKCSQLKAEKCLQAVINGDTTATTEFSKISKNIRYSELIELEQFCLLAFIELASEFGFNVIIHTGFHAWGNNDPSACHCDFLYKTIRKFNKVKFILLHCGYPYEDDAITLAKYYSNVYIDLAWVHQMDRMSCVRIIGKLIEGVPINKVIAFGGDYCNPINTIGALKLAESNFSEAFGVMCEKGMLTIDEGKDILKKWYYDNPKDIYGF